jgi:hypothetical protein
MNHSRPEARGAHGHAYDKASAISEVPPDVEAEMEDDVLKGGQTRHYVTVSQRW